MSAKTWNSYSFSINGFPVQARFAQEDIHGLFVPLLRRLALLQREKGERLIVFLAAPPAAGKSTLAAYLSLLSRELPDCLPMQALGLDGFHFHQDYILTHNVRQKDGHILPMRQVKGSPETYDLLHLSLIHISTSSIGITNIGLVFFLFIIFRQSLTNLFNFFLIFMIVLIVINVSIDPS